MKRKFIFLTAVVSTLQLFAADFAADIEMDIEEDGFEALYEAATGNYTPMRTYVEKGDVNFQDESGIGFLHVATLRGDENEVSWLLSRKANPNLQTATGLAPLHLACSIPQAGFLQLTLWMERALTITNRLLANGANPNIRTELGITPLHMSSSMLSADDTITDLGIELPKVRESLAAKARSLATKVKSLTKTSQGKLVLTELASGGVALGTVGIVTGAGALAGVFAGPAIVGAVPIGAVLLQLRVKLGRVQSLIKHGANVNAIDNFRNTPLHYLASGYLKDVSLKGRRGAVLIAVALRKAGANVSAKNSNGYTPYTLARRYNRKLLEATLKPVPKPSLPKKGLFKNF